MRRFAILAVLLAACASEEDLSSTLTIENDSSFSFVEINLAAVDSPTFGPDLLGADTLDPGDVLELSNVPCDTYDIRITDEDGDQCILDTVDLCLDNAVWRIDDTELAICTL
jgi:hypothetical protein